MLCDTWLAHLLAQLARPPRPGELSADVSAADIGEIDDLKRAQRFVFAPDAARVAAELAEPEAVARVRHAAITPARETWLEWSDPAGGKRLGVLLAAADADHPGAGHGLIVSEALSLNGTSDVLGLPIDWNLAGPGGVLKLDLEPMMVGVLNAGYPGHLDSLDCESAGLWLVAALALLAAPRVTAMREADLSRLNKKRRRLGRPEFLSHREIVLRLSAEMADAAYGASSETDRVGRALHHVRAHFRLLPGRAALVRPHWRGDPALGVVQHHHVVRE